MALLGSFNFQFCTRLAAMFPFEKVGGFAETIVNGRI